MKLSQLRKIIKEEYSKILAEEFTPTDDTVMILIGQDDKHYPWYIKKIDSTHLKMGNNEQSIINGYPMVAHIGELRNETYYEDLQKWLHGRIKSSEINGKKYRGNG